MFKKIALAAAASLLSGAITFAQNPNANPVAQEKAPHHPGRLIIQFKPGVDEAHKEAVHNQLDTKAHKRLKKVKGLEVRELNGRKSLQETIAAYQATGLVEYAEPDYRVKARRVPNDPEYLAGKLWHLHNTGQEAGLPDADLDAPEAWDLRAISNTVVAVIDSGVRYTHEDLQGNMWRNPDEIPGNHSDDDGNGYVDDVFGINTINGSGNPNDDEGHGTHIAGTIGAAGNNGKGVTGVAWAVKIMALKFLDTDGGGYTSDAVEAIDYARSKGAKVINTSWGGVAYSQALYDAINRARSAGMILVAAAGNESADNDTTAEFPANYALDNIISVAATTRLDRLADYSNFGAKKVELGAPGDEIYSTSFASDTSYMTASGTSMAVPQVAGALAVLRTHFPSDTRAQTQMRLLRTVDPLPALAGKTSTGGRLNLRKALATRPGNDQFAAAPLAINDSFRVTGTNFAGTRETGEPRIAGKPGGASIWWKWTALASGTVIARTAGSNFNTLLGVYTGEEVSQLTPIAANDNTGTLTTSAVSFEAVAGTTYHFAVDGSGGAWGNVMMTVFGPPSGEPNNAFSRRIRLTGSSFATTGTNLAANKEVLEPNHAGNPGGKSVWWSWVAPTSGYYTIDTSGSSFDTLLAVYAGTRLALVRALARNDDADSQTEQSRVRFYARAGRVYQIAVDGFDGESGDIQLTGRYQ